jgi:hypothetical protein
LHFLESTQIVNDVTTVNVIRVVGTYLSGGQYAQIVHSNVQVFGKEISSTATGFPGQYKKLLIPFDE